MLYSKGVEEDEEMHKKLHEQFELGVSFKVRFEIRSLTTMEIEQNFS